MRNMGPPWFTPNVSKLTIRKSKSPKSLKQVVRIGIILNFLGVRFSSVPLTLFLVLCTIRCAYLGLS